MLSHCINPLLIGLFNIFKKKEFSIPKDGAKQPFLTVVFWEEKLKDLI